MKTFHSNSIWKSHESVQCVDIGQVYSIHETMSDPSPSFNQSYAIWSITEKWVVECFKDLEWDKIVVVVVLLWYSVIPVGMKWKRVASSLMIEIVTDVLNWRYVIISYPFRWWKILSYMLKLDRFRALLLGSIHLVSWWVTACAAAFAIRFERMDIEETS